MNTNAGAAQEKAFDAIAASAAGLDVDSFIGKRMIRIHSNNGGGADLAISRFFAGQGEGSHELGSLITRVQGAVGDTQRGCTNGVIIILENGRYWAFEATNSLGLVWTEYSTGRQRSINVAGFRSYDSRVVAAVDGYGQVVANLGRRRFWHS